MLRKNVCTFCAVIEKLILITAGPFKGGYYPPENKNQIVQSDDGQYHIWHDGNGDPYMAEITETNIHRCPVCGREL